MGVIVRGRGAAGRERVRQVLTLAAVGGPVFVFLVQLVRLGVMKLRGGEVAGANWMMVVVQPIWVCAVILMSVWSLKWWTGRGWAER